MGGGGRREERSSKGIVIGIVGGIVGGMVESRVSRVLGEGKVGAG